ncbi:MAG TPA: hypothetical protein VGM75_10955 [Pseudonocardiaceae bacterium]
MIVIAHISELNIDNAEHSVQRATRVLNHLNDLPFTHSMTTFG